ncbi:AAA family ATPase [Vibrio lentus]|uniref:AAA family ATPase n=1 Tax=Vibrio lentus TaxID=136468 RepID=UPI000C8180EF|nr:AAA family ATPase [Vibrio lentus]PMG56244.1 AAA family ATPase [Vibrio lentus]PMN02244.1 AAA family ATPase [Vibrio lentus]
MSGYLTKIKTKIPHSTKEVDINVDGKTLILTGGNGCGKTSLIDYLFNKLTDSIVKRENYDLERLHSDLRSQEMHLATLGPADSQHKIFTTVVKETREKIAGMTNPVIVLDNLDEYVVSYQNLTSLLTKFGAMRKSDITKPSAVTSLESLKDTDVKSIQQHQNKTASSMFEQFLVTNIANQAFSESSKINNDPIEAERIDKWFKKLELGLKDLFEDDQLKLIFKSESLSFEIHQPTKEPYTFQTLSSGFSSIMSIYADLITKVSLRSVNPDDLTGIVLIDEIDAHLHVSLQKKILAFLKKSFPKVQFIVTTHSPFVVSSVDDAVIYDLSKLEQVEDLSMYSYEAVLEGLFGVLPISSLLQQNIQELAQLLEKNPVDIEEVQLLLDKIPQEESLDSESLYFVNSAKLVINKAKR